MCALLNILFDKHIEISFQWLGKYLWAHILSSELSLILLENMKKLGSGFLSLRSYWFSQWKRKHMSCPPLLPNTPTQRKLQENNTAAKNEEWNCAVKWQLWKEFRNQRPVRAGVLREGSGEELVLEVSLAGGAEPAEAVETGWVSPGWRPTAGKPRFQ